MHVHPNRKHAYKHTNTHTHTNNKQANIQMIIFMDNSIINKFIHCAPRNSSSFTKIFRIYYSLDSVRCCAFNVYMHILWTHFVFKIFQLKCNYYLCVMWSLMANRQFQWYIRDWFLLFVKIILLYNIGFVCIYSARGRYTTNSFYK